jgi:KTSC domain
MERKRVSSSRIRAVGYDPKERVLEVEFSDGRVLAYTGVSSEVHRQFMAAPSPSSYFEDKIEEDFPSRRV